MKRDFLEITDFSREEILQTMQLALEVKHLTKEYRSPQPLTGKNFALIFHKPSLRTRMSFEVGINQLGGNTLFITDKEIELGKRESVHDVAKVLSRYVDAILIRTFSHENVVELAQHASVPVVNMLTDLTHPCQIMSDLLTVYERRPDLSDLKISYFGDGNNITNSWINLAARLPMRLFIATHKSTPPDAGIMKRARAAGLSEIILTDDAATAARDADVLYTDVWASMGQKDQLESKVNLLKDFQLSKNLTDLAKPDHLVMHCLPAERGREITDEVMDGPNSVVFDEAENRMHAQKAILMQLLGGF